MATTMESPKRTKRGQNEGGCYQRKDGRWEASITLAVVNGKPKRKSYYGKTKAQAMAAMRAARREREAGLPIDVPRQTVGQFLEAWLDDTVKPSKAPKTYASYAEVLRLHVIPTLGQHRLPALTPQHVAALLAAKQAAGLSPRRVHHIRAVLRTALNQAMRWGFVARNAAALTEPVRQEHREVVPFTVGEARTILAACDGARMGALFRVVLTLGLRQGEVLGLMWDDINLDGRTLRVRRALQRMEGRLIVKEPKTAKSKRALKLPPSLVAALQGHRDRQAFERQAAGERWQEGGFVFTTTIGTPLDPRNVIRQWHALLAVAGVERREFHATRHTAVSVMIAQGVPLKVIQEVVGHSLLSTTADTYGHLTPAAFDEAAEAMERALTGTG